MENFTNEAGSIKYPELLINILDTMLHGTNQDFVELCFQWKMHLLHEKEWCVNATHNKKIQVDRRHSLVLCRINYLELKIMRHRDIDFYFKISLVDLRSCLEFFLWQST